MLVSTLPLAGCVTAEQQANLQAQSRQCLAMKATHFQKATCLNTAEQAVYGSNSLMLEKYAARLRIATEEDAGRMTPEQGQAEFMAVVARLQGQAEQQDREAAALALVALSSSSAAAPPRPVTCVRLTPQMTTCQ
jgi:hypothetical protein